MDYFSQANHLLFINKCIILSFLSCGYRFIFVLGSFPVLHYVLCHVTISRGIAHALTFWREFHLHVAVLVCKTVL